MNNKQHRVDGIHADVELDFIKWSDDDLPAECEDFQPSRSFR